MCPESTPLIMKDNTLKLEPFHREVLCWHVKPLQELFLLTGYSCKGPPYDLLTMWPLGFSFPFILAFSAFIVVILAFWAFTSFHFGLMGLLFLSFWPFGLSFAFILAFSTCQKKPSGQDLAQNCDFPCKMCNFSFSKICLLGLHFLSFWPFGLAFPFILAFWAFLSFWPFLGLHFLSFWPFGRSFPFILASFWPFGLSFPFILAFWAFMSFHFGLLGFHFLSFWPFEPSFPFILAF